MTGALIGGSLGTIPARIFTTPVDKQIGKRLGNITGQYPSDATNKKVADGAKVYKYLNILSNIKKMVN